MVDLSIIIVNWNASEHLRQCLHSIYNSGARLSLETIVVDNASTDGSVAMVCHEFPQVRLIRQHANRGFAAGNNLALSGARGRAVLLLNNDTILLPAALDAMMDFLDAHAEVGIVGPRVLNPDGTLQPSCRSFPSLPAMLFRALYLDKLFPNHAATGALWLSHWDYASVREVDAVSGCCLLARRAMIDQVGSLDERFFMYFEEIDWAYRARQLDWRVMFTPGAQIIHCGGQSASHDWARVRMLHSQSLIRYFAKHHGPASALAVRLLATAEVGLRLGYWSLGYLGRGSQRALAERQLELYWPAMRWLVTGQAGQAASGSPLHP